MLRGSGDPPVVRLVECWKRIVTEIAAVGYFLVLILEDAVEIFPAAVGSEEIDQGSCLGIGVVIVRSWIYQNPRAMELWITSCLTKTLCKGQNAWWKPKLDNA